MDKSIIIRRSWKSQIILIIFLILIAPLTLYLTFKFPQTVFSGRILTIFGKDFYLSIPFLWFIPSGILGFILWQIYNVQYSLSAKGIETITGILGTNQKISRIRFEDIRSIEVIQSIPDRLLNIGEIQIGTAATSGIEIDISCVEAPHEIKKIIQIERDRRQKVN